MKVKSQEQKLAVPEPALIKDLDSRCVNTKLIKLNWNQVAFILYILIHLGAVYGFIAGRENILFEQWLD